MKKLILWLGGIFLVSCVHGWIIPQKVFGETEQTETLGNNISITFGLKDWFLRFGQTYPMYFGNAKGEFLDYSDEGSALIPSLTLKYKNAFISTGYLTTNGNLKFPQTISAVVTNGQITDWVSEVRSASRNELDINFGYFIHPLVAISLGYKEMHRKYYDRSFLYSAPQNVTESSSERKTSGPILGVLIAVPLTAAFGGYGNFSYGILKTYYDPSDSPSPVPTTSQTSYVSSEIGVSYRWKLMSVILGYKYQFIEIGSNPLVNPGYDQDSLDILKGFILGVNMTL